MRLILILEAQHHNAWGIHWLSLKKKKNHLFFVHIYKRYNIESNLEL